MTYYFSAEARCSLVVKALSYNPKGRGFDTRRGGCFKFTNLLSLPAALGPGVLSASNRNEYQKQKNKFLGIKCGR
jgi:hypothetical protein